MSGWVIGDCSLIGFLRAAHKPKSNGTYRCNAAIGLGEHHMVFA